MSAIGAPSLDYRRFLSDAGSGLVALVSLAIITYICGNNSECNFEFVTTLYGYFIQIFPLLVNSAGIFETNKLLNTTDELFEKVLGINLKGAFLWMLCTVDFNAL